MYGGNYISIKRFCNRCCKRESVECNALKEWKKHFQYTCSGLPFKEFYSQNTNLLPLRAKCYFKHLRKGIQDFHRKYGLVPAYKATKLLLSFEGYTI